MQPYDYLIVGGGPAGCVLANRLTEDPETRVALLEAGPDRNARRAIVRIPLAMVSFMAPALAFLGGPKFMQWFTSEPEPGLQGRTLALPRGQGIGGCTNVNGQIFIRGQHQDFDHWRDLGCTGWGHADLLPYFRKLERFEPLALNQSKGIDPACHGTDGPLNIAPPRSLNPLTRLFLSAAQHTGIAFNPDFNGREQAGAGLYTFTQRHGERVTAEGAYLNPVRHRPNLTILPNRRATRLLMQGTTATGVAWTSGTATGETHARETILSAGSFASPHLLLLSGIGPAAALKRHGIPLVHDLPGVGENLQDHLDVTLQFKAKTATPYGISWRALPRNIGHVLDWFTRKRGLFASTTAEAGAFITTDGSDRPDIQLFFCAGVANTQEAKGFTGHGTLFHACHLRPGSIGSLTLASANPTDKPVIRYNFFRGASSMDALRAGIRTARKIAAAAPFAPHLAEEITPGAGEQTDGALDAFIRQTVGTLFHPVGTCAMGTGPMAVTDPQTLRVHGLQGLRVVDASVMPAIPSGNTVAATYCLAEKAADLIRTTP